MTITYCAGFLVHETSDRVALIRKARPAWQAGRLNAIGGKVEPGELPREAMRREFHEEAGLDLNAWQPLAQLRGAASEWRVFFYRCFATAEVLESVRSMTDEEVGVYSVGQLLNGHRNLILPNLRWLLPLAISAETFDTIYVTQR